MDIFCSFCRNPCQYRVINEGIGSYEYWGSHGYDEQLVVVSKCCGEACIDENNMEITPDEIQQYEDFLKEEQTSNKE